MVYQLFFRKDIIHMNEIQNFVNEKFGTIRTVVINNDPIFCR